MYCTILCTIHKVPPLAPAVCFVVRGTEVEAAKLESSAVVAVVLSPRLRLVLIALN